MKALKIVPELCTGCMRCELACSYEQTGTFQPSKSVIRVSAFENHTSYAPYTCLQCDEGWCMTACPVEAILISPAGAKDVVDDICVPIAIRLLSATSAGERLPVWTSARATPSCTKKPRPRIGSDRSPKSVRTAPAVRLHRG